ncbi:endonuclease domain-containing 1 protein-like [Protopterus annectens]|uniref:endonuclease domain-containing 1 protein-like n=1 Tax=Protopterus annectens TaxID=7888 RepID=UPI001CF939F4|nr:endonuclease domain-containing 1 protein-like [Protopterus annectens]
MHFVEPVLPVWWACFFFFTNGKGEVMTVTSFIKCKQFFFKEMEPSGIVPPKAARICQHYNNKYHFATMYDRDLRIPLYSAYMFEKNDGGCRSDEWLIEPQLVDPKISKSMEEERSSTIDKIKLQESQAVNGDYVPTSAMYDRGHLNPCSHHSNQDSKTATFTLTNIVPQLNTLNQGKWREYEEGLTGKTTSCTKVYVVVGVIPGNSNINNRVNVPSDIWSAICCVEKTRTRSWAVIAANNANQVNDISVSDLENRIKSYTGRGVKLFPAKC